jgi:hypothetical protein
MAILSGFCTRRYMVHVSTEAVVSWPATSMDSRSSRSCVEDTSSRAAIRNLQQPGGGGVCQGALVHTGGTGCTVVA